MSQDGPALRAIVRRGPPGGAEPDALGTGGPAPPLVVWPADGADDVSAALGSLAAPEGADDCALLLNRDDRLAKSGPADEGLRALTADPGLGAVFVDDVVPGAFAAAAGAPRRILVRRAWWRALTATEAVLAGAENLDRLVRLVVAGCPAAVVGPTAPVSRPAARAPAGDDAASQLAVAAEQAWRSLARRRDAVQWELMEVLAELRDARAQLNRKDEDLAEMWTAFESHCAAAGRRELTAPGRSQK